ncbi:MAG: hypothetical protein U9Q04_05135 [Campylobacterota bacterium]|nr:hypothetical protein [Campylobacterota bacterium]
MSANIQTMNFGNEEYYVIPKNYRMTLKELVVISGYSERTIHRAKKDMEEGKHYFQPNNGKLYFAIDAVVFLDNRKENQRESKQGNNQREKKQPISADQFIDQW